ncbi:unnamed protein product, partial [Laminaria digitata]
PLFQLATPPGFQVNNIPKGNLVIHTNCPPVQDVRRVYSEEPEWETDDFRRYSKRNFKAGVKSRGGARLSSHPFGRRGERDAAEGDAADGDDPGRYAADRDAADGGASGRDGADGDGADGDGSDGDGSERDESEGGAQSSDTREPDPESEELDLDSVE